MKSMTVSQNPVTISTTAAVEIKKMMATKNIPEGYGLRVGVRGGGCGVQLILGFDKPKETDLVYEYEGIPVMFEKRHMMFLIGKQVEFYEGADARGFHFMDAKREN
jgi:iron-sulfur cluster assembly protein